MSKLWLKRVPNIRLAGPRLHIRPPVKSDMDDWIDIRVRNLDFLRPWEPQRPASFLTKRGYINYIASLHANWEAGRGASFFIIDNETDALMGGVNMNNIRRGVVQSANVGYWLGEEFTQQGFMFEALGLCLNYAFNVQNLHRIEAACLTENTASRRLLEKIGFSEEGLARKYLCINGQWQDHVTYAILESDSRPNPYE
ncbi:GNAT family N-acetyltransferase [Curvivirga aplysinae]|uniref:GNAT family N-acetyltransferase n=1 Tax=Curvivirga aplysinae TaxID=2529852 RepID=UPI0012BBE64A|nr:GNAT family N-acetyltransferase [Curvivirga aplysinae]MTI09235.1 GNAT family N-acetyltransferase [Curvivirga aplysinae]